MAGLPSMAFYYFVILINFFLLPIFVAFPLFALFLYSTLEMRSKDYKPVGMWRFPSRPSPNFVTMAKHAGEATKDADDEDMTSKTI